jgi:hypothetical protein
MPLLPFFKEWKNGNNVAPAFAGKFELMQPGANVIKLLTAVIY